MWFDFAAAFPLASRAFIKSSLQRLGPSEHALALVSPFYHGVQCKLALAGDSYDGFVMIAGVRQGCPLFPFLYGVAADSLLRALRKAVLISVRFCRRHGHEDQ